MNLIEFDCVSEFILAEVGWIDSRPPLRPCVQDKGYTDGWMDGRTIVLNISYFPLRLIWIQVILK